MKQTLRYSQKQKLALTPSLQTQIKLLSLPGYEIRFQLLQLVEKFLPDEEDETVVYFKDEFLKENYLKFQSSRNNSVLEEINILKEESLRESLLNQFNLLNLEEFQYLIGEYLIDSIEENGKLDLKIDFEDLKLLVKEEFNLVIKDQLIEDVLKRIQRLDPIGCGCRNLTESLVIQIEELDLSETSKKDLVKIVKEIAKNKITFDEIKEEYKLNLNKLNINPGYSIGSNKSLYIRPDILAFKNKEKWEITFSDPVMPNELLKKLSCKVKDSNSASKNEANTLIKGIERRQETLLSVARFLVNKQKKFLNDESELLPVTLKEISDSIKLSQSTISRILNSKYLQLPSRTIQLNQLMEKKVNIRSGGKNISQSKLLELIENIVTSEKKDHLLSDENIREILKSKHSVEIARRTVCKYREEAKISSIRAR